MRTGGNYPTVASTKRTIVVVYSNNPIHQVPTKYQNFPSTLKSTKACTTELRSSCKPHEGFLHPGGVLIVVLPCAIVEPLSFSSRL